MEYAILIFLTLAINIVVTILYTRRQIKLSGVRKAKEDRLENVRQYLAAFLLRSADPNAKDEVKHNLCEILVHLDTGDDDNKELYKLINDYLHFIMNNDPDENRVEEIIKQANKTINAEPLA